MLAFMCSRGVRAAALEPHGCHWDRAGAYRFWVHEDLTPADRKHIAEISATCAAASPAKVAAEREELTPADRQRIAELLARTEEENL